MPFYAIMFDPNGNGTGPHSYAEEPAAYPANELPCTEAQAQTPMLWSNVNGVLTPNLAQAQAQQIALIQSSASQAEQAPVSLTLSSGVTASFGMTPHDWTKIVGIYAKYVAKGATLPSGYTIPDITGKAQAVTVSDIENLMNAGESQIQATIVKAQTLIGQIEAATTVSGVQAIVW